MWLSHKDEHNLLFRRQNQSLKTFTRTFDNMIRVANSLQSAYPTPMRHVHTINIVAKHWDTLWSQIPNNLKVFDKNQLNL